MDYKDYYKILGVKRNATTPEIRKAYRRLARKYHPDVSKEINAEAHFKEINEANEVLKDQKKRQAYDHLGKNWQAGQNFRPPPNWNNQNTGNSSFFEDIANQQYTAGGKAGFSDFFEGLFGDRGFKNQKQGFSPFQSTGYQQKQQKMDQTATIHLALEDVYHGIKKTIRLPNGTNLQIKIPKEITEGKKIRLNGKAQNGGNLYLKIKFNPHKLFDINGKNVTLKLPISPWEAALGTSVTVPTLGGKIKMKIPTGSQTGQKLRLKGRGLPGTPAGDQYLLLQIQTPTIESSDQYEFYSEMKKKFSWNPRKNKF